MNNLSAVRAQEYAKVYDELLQAAARLDMLRRLEGGDHDPRASAAMYGLQFAAVMLWPAVPGSPPPGYRHDSEKLLHLAVDWREVALGLGRFQPERPSLRLVARPAPQPRPGHGQG
ncbi:hypothetical protein ABZ135_23395 [Streptomyces sp. NPDC006339]|uniref:hypothetical protein n=1 Tax=Streptomyces sp. NPDC006339 TaxID=3156755 RepID=UPI0033BD2F34